MDITIKTILSSFKPEKVTYNNYELIITKPPIWNGVNESNTEINIKIDGEDVDYIIGMLHFNDNTELEEKIKKMFSRSDKDANDNLRKLFYLSKNFGIEGLGGLLGIEKVEHYRGKYDSVDFEQNPIAKALMMDSVYASTKEASIYISETNRKKTIKKFTIKDGDCDIVLKIYLPDIYVYSNNTNSDYVKVKEINGAQERSRSNKDAVETFFEKVKEMYKNGSEEIRRLLEIYGDFDLS